MLQQSVVEPTPLPHAEHQEIFWKARYGPRAKQTASWHEIERSHIVPYLICAVSVISQGKTSPPPHWPKTKNLILKGDGPICYLCVWGREGGGRGKQETKTHLL